MSLRKLTCKNALLIPVVSWVRGMGSCLGSVYLKSTLTCKNALIIPVASWVVYTWNLQLICKNALTNAVVSRLVYT